MTKACDRILKDANGHISDHLRSHVHLTNCIHLKNHIHKHSPILTDRSLTRNLVILQRSRSLRDPSMSPPSWPSPSVVDLLHRGRKNETVLGTGRRSVDIDRHRNHKELSGSSPHVGSFPASQLALRDLSRDDDGPAGVSGRSTKGVVRGRRRVKKEEANIRNSGTHLMNRNSGPMRDGSDLIHDIFSGNSEERNYTINHTGGHEHDYDLKTLSEQLNDVLADCDGLISSNVHLHGRSLNENVAEEAEASIRGHSSGLNKVKRGKFRAVKRVRNTTASRDTSAQNEMSVASNSLAHNTACPKHHKAVGEEDAERDFVRAPTNGCGIPWNWSRIHHRGKTILDMAGRSFSCGLSDTKSKKSGPVPRGRDGVGMPVMSDCSSSSSKSDAEELPLLDASGSHENAAAAAWVHDYSGELDIFANNLLKHEIDSDLASEARSGGQRKFRRHRNGMQQSLTQKYMPRTFRELVGQNLVALALSNAVVKRKVGLLYVFYGPRGTGKTSCARIFARALNCQSLEHPKPCGFCNSCIADDIGKSQNIKEVRPFTNFDFESLIDLLESMIVSQLPSLYRVFIFDDCDTLPSDCWSAISKVIDRAPRRMVFILVCSTPDVLPHIIISRCQKFFFPKLKDADIIYTLQWIATKEDLEIDKDALKLIASRSYGSLRDAEMTLEQLSLLAQNISVPLVQELVGLISDEKLVGLLDLALSADTVNTVKILREIMESGVEPLALMSQLATVITDILAGSYDFAKERSKRKFFRRQALSKEDMEKLRQALKTLSEAEKQLRMSNDRLTWLTAALLQLAPDQQYMLRSSSAETSIQHSPLDLTSVGRRERAQKTNSEHAEKNNTDRSLSTNSKLENHQAGSSSNVYYNAKMECTSIDRREHAGVGKFHQWTNVPGDRSRIGCRQLQAKFCEEIEEIWLAVLEKLQINSIKEFMYQEGRLISVSFGAAPTVQLLFSSRLTKSKAEKFRAHILQAFEAVLGSPVIIEIRCESNKDVDGGVNLPLTLPAPQNGSSQIYSNQGQQGSTMMGRNEIVEIEASPREQKGNVHIDGSSNSDRRGRESIQVGKTIYTHKNSAIASILERRKLGELNQSQSLVKSKVSLAHVIQQAEGCTQKNGWSKCKAVSIAEKLEQENLRLEPRSRSLLLWKTSTATRRKFSRMKIRPRRPHTLLKIVSCGKCFSAKSPG